MPLDRDKLIKVMALTASDKDGEALAALRMANRLIAAEKLTWAEVLRAPPPKVKISVARDASPWWTEPSDMHAEDWNVEPHLRNQETLGIIFKAIYAQPRTGNEDYWRVIDSIHEGFLKHGCVTGAGYSIIREAYRRATSRV